ncbi:hypothetical protein Cgig2_031712 [Carnegiea gigantea]|uniref:Phytocyanin domain-containing protein n=1 Tax=Carnegiea gigantea TaxID=171969 RepID=A0A9Q1QM19_9CARY|nr:hypothetical protein Cgig2_031712 [Carnegiea gigantea]
MALAVVFLVMLLSTPAVFGTDYNIDWSLSGDYSSWATRPLVEGDSLVFTYGSSHSVDVVSKSDYDSCVSSNAIQSTSNSPTTITLKAGTTYIICGTPGHCSPTGGMKLQVTAKAASGGSGSTPATPTTTPAPAGGSPSTPASSGGSTPAPSGNGVAGSLSGAHLSFGLGMGALVALLG